MWSVVDGSLHSVLEIVFVYFRFLRLRWAQRKHTSAVYLILNLICIINNVQLIVFILYIHVEILDEDIYLFLNYLFVQKTSSLRSCLDFFCTQRFWLVCMIWQTMDWPPLATVHAIKYFRSSWLIIDRRKIFHTAVDDLIFFFLFSHGIKVSFTFASHSTY